MESLSILRRHYLAAVAVEPNAASQGELSLSGPRRLLATWVVFRFQRRAWLLTFLLAAVVAVGAVGTAYASTFPATESVDTFERAAENPLSDGGKWSKLGWTKTIGRVFSATFGWVPKEGGARAPESEADGAYWNAKEFTEPAVSAHMYAENLHDYVGIWCDSTGTGSKNGYRLKVVGTATNYGFKLILEKWVSGTRTQLAESSEVLFKGSSHENVVGITAINGKISGWYGTSEASLAVKVEASDTTFSHGYIGIEGTNDDAYGETQYRASQKGSPPSNTALPSAGPLSGWSNWLEGQIFTATTGSWQGTEPISYSYQWQICNSGGEGCTNIAGATSAEFTSNSSDVGHTLRVSVTAKNSAGSAVATSPAGDVIATQSSPEAHVINGAGETVQSYGNTYAGGAGGQIQLAENFAAAHADAKVVLDPGTFHIYHYQNLEDGGYVTDVFLYSGAIMEGSEGEPSVIESDLTGTELEQIHNAGELLDVVRVAVSPGARSEAGGSLDVAFLTIKSNEQATYGFNVGHVSGSYMSVRHITAGETLGGSMVIGYPGEPVEGASGSQAQVIDNTVYDAGSDGIEVDGSNMNVAYNGVEDAPNESSNGVSAFSNSSSLDIHGNTLTHVTVGVGLDGTSPGEYGEGGGKDPETEDGFGKSIDVYENTVHDSCRGIVLYRQTDDYVSANELVEDSGFVPEKEGLHCMGTDGNAPDNNVGILVSNAYSNYVYGNTLQNFLGIGIWLWDTGQSPLGTHYNGVGVYYNGTEFPVDGNEIYNGGFAMVADDQTHSERVTGNTFRNNIAHSSGKGCYFEQSEVATGNEPISCN